MLAQEGSRKERVCRVSAVALMMIQAAPEYKTPCRVLSSNGMNAGGPAIYLKTVVQYENVSCHFHGSLLDVSRGIYDYEAAGLLGEPASNVGAVSIWKLSSVLFLLKYIKRNNTLTDPSCRAVRKGATTNADGTLDAARLVANPASDSF